MVDSERIKRSRRIGIEQKGPQSVVVHDSTERDDTLTFIITIAEFPFPGFELVPGVSEFTQIAFQPASEGIVVRLDLDCSQTGFDRAVTHTGSERRSRGSGALDREDRSC